MTERPVALDVVEHALDLDYTPSIDAGGLSGVGSRYNLHIRA